MKRIILITILLTSILAACSTSNPKVDDFAKCLTKEGMTMYGAYWCPHCANVKKMFGSSFKYVHYVECDPKGKNAAPELCEQAGVKSFPHFTFQDGTELVGEQSFTALAEPTSCTPPN